MDKEFEEWFFSEFQYIKDWETYPVIKHNAEKAWNASKQHWLDKKISQRECYQRGFNAGINKAAEVAENYGSVTGADAIRDLK